MHRAVVVQWSRLGDLLQTRPLLNHILRQAPDVQVTLCADSRYTSVVAAMPENVEFWPVDLARLSDVCKHSSSHARAMTQLREVLGRSPEIKADDVYVLSRSLPATIFAEMLHPTRIFGYRREKDALAIPAIIEWLDNAAQAGNRVPVQLADLWTCLDGADRKPQWLTPLKRAHSASNTQAHGMRQVGLLCDAGELHRVIPAEWLADVARRLTAEGDTQVTLFGSSAPVGNDDHLAATVKCNVRVVDERGKLTLERYTMRLAEQDVVIGPDTGGLHLAIALGVPVIGLYFGGASCLNTGPYALQSVVIQEPRWDVETAPAVVVLSSHASEEAVRTPITTQVSLHWPRLDEFGLCYTSPSWTREDCDKIKAKRKSFFTRIGTSAGADAKLQNEPSDGVSIIIPECGQSHYTDELLPELLLALADLNGEVIIVSSGGESDHASPVRDERVRQIQSDAPLSFAQACNLGARHAQHDRLLFLNNDTRFLSTELQDFLNRAPADKIASPVIRYVDGVIQNCGVALRDGKVVELGHGREDAGDAQGGVDAVSAVALLVNKTIFETLGGFDESFVNGYEDLDFCLRAREKAIGSDVVNSTSVMHFRGATEGRFTHEEPNWVRFRERWKDSLEKQRSSQERNSKNSAPLLVLSPESACAAGSSLRWSWPLQDLRLRPGHHFTWMTEAEALRDPQSLDRLLSDASGIVVFRPFETEWMLNRLLNALTETQAMLLVDSDDLLLGRFPEYSPRGVARRGYEQRFRALLDHATIITASTDALAGAMGSFGYQAQVLPSAPNQRIRRAACTTNKTINEFRIGFFGTPSHLLDLGSIVPALIGVLNEYPQVRFYWWGCRPGELAFHPQVRQGGPMVEDYATHLNRLGRFGLDLTVVPLLDTPASRMKTAVKYFEYASAGIPAVYSAVPPYRDMVDHGRTGWLANETTASWVHAIRSLVENAELRENIANEARADVESRADNTMMQMKLEELVTQVAPSLGAAIKNPSRKESKICLV